MGYYCKPKTYDTHTSNVVVLLVVALILLGIPWLFARETAVAVEEKKTNWSVLVIPIVVLLILLLLSLIGVPKKTYVKPLPPPPCYRCKHVCYCYFYPKGC